MVSFLSFWKPKQKTTYTSQDIENTIFLLNTAQSSYFTTPWLNVLLNVPPTPPTRWLFWTFLIFVIIVLASFIIYIAF